MTEIIVLSIKRTFALSNDFIREFCDVFVCNRRQCQQNINEMKLSANSMDFVHDYFHTVTTNTGYCFLKPSLLII